MDAQLEKIRDQQKASWNKFSPGWKKWDEQTMEFLKPFGDEMINLLQPKDGDVILDIASGTGEPALTIASKVGSGKVVATDLSEGMIATAAEEAKKRGITNFETKVCDVTELPFDDNSFDGVTCRMGFMFFPDMKVALEEMKRVVKPGGKIVTAVWAAPEKNFWAGSIMGPIKNNISIEPLPPGAPGLFRCAEPGFMADLFRSAGLKNVEEKEVSGYMRGESPEEYWNMMTEIAAPIVAALDKADDNLTAKIKKEALDNIRSKFPTNPVKFDTLAFIISGTK